MLRKEQLKLAHTVLTQWKGRDYCIILIVFNVNSTSYMYNLPSGSTRRSISPSFFALSALTFLPVSIMSRESGKPT